MKKLKAKERRTNEHKVRLNNEEEKRKNKALRKHKKNSVADLFRHWLEIDLQPQNSEAENYLDKMFDNPIDQINNLKMEDK